MEIYHYDPRTGEFTGNGNADPDPLMEGGWLIPAHATSDAPPPPGAGQVAAYRDGAWVLEPDHRGEIRYDTSTGRPVEITAPGPVPATLTAIAPPRVTAAWDGEGWVPDLAALKAAKLAEVNAGFEVAMRELLAGYPISEVMTWWKQELEAAIWNADQSAPTVLIDAIALARGVTKAALVARILAKADVFDAAIGRLLGKRQAAGDRLDAATTAAEVEAVRWGEADA